MLSTCHVPTPTGGIMGLLVRLHNDRLATYFVGTGFSCLGIQVTLHDGLNSTSLQLADLFQTLFYNLTLFFLKAV